MKTKLLAIALLLSAASTGWAQSSQPTTATLADALPAPSAPAVVARGPNHRVWERIIYEPGPGGRPVPKAHRYTELATGMHYLMNNQWVESSDQIEITATGAQAINSQHQVAFLGNINAPGAVDITLPEGAHLTSNILGLSYFDTASDDSVMIAQVKDSDGALLPAGNTVLYRDAFSGVSADVLYINSIHGLEQLIVLRQQPPPPSAWGLNPSTTVLEVITEFLNPPEPRITPHRLDGALDHHLAFGVMQMGRGEAFALGSEANTIDVTKQWLVMNGRKCLVEQVPLRALQSQLQNLPPASPGSARLRNSPESVLYRLANRHLLPERPPTGKPTSALKLAAAPPPAQGVVLDYTLLTSQTNLTLQGDTTYYVSGTVNIAGTTTIEGCTVVKFASSPAATLITTNLLCKTEAYRPAIWTGKDDNTVGETISGSSGNPTTKFYAGLALDLSSASYPKVTGMRFSYLSNALAGADITLQDCQLVRCLNGINASPGRPTLYNVLLCNLGSLVNKGSCTGGGDALTAVNVTAHFCTNLLCDTSGQAHITNCLFVCVTNWHCSSTTTNTSAFLDTDPGVFQTVRGAAHYLASDSPYRNAGTTNLPPALLAGLRAKTTYPPTVYSNVTFSTDTTFTPQAQRDTDIPDLGYHYDPLDYLFGGVTADANLTFTPGTAVGWFHTSQGWYHAGHGIHVGDTRTLTFAGTAEQPVYWARGHTVQEGIPTLWEGGYGPGGITGWTLSSFDNVAKVVARFTRFCGLAAGAMHTREDNGMLAVRATHCEFYSAGEGGYGSQVLLTNCLLDRVSFWTSWHTSCPADCGLTLENCLFHGGFFSPNRSIDTDPPWTFCSWVFHDTAFDATDIQTYDDAGGDASVTDLDYNAFLDGAPRTDPQGANDLIVTNSFNWQTNWFGNYYLPTNSPLVDRGRTNADVVGLYHFTTQTNQIKETNSVVDISYHYVAVDANVRPIDTDGDAIPDYLEDANGNGSVDSGETDWLTYNSINGLNGTNGLQVFTPLK